MTILIILITFGLCMILLKVVGIIGGIIGFVFKGIGFLVALPFKIVGYTIHRL